MPRGKRIERVYTGKAAKLDEKVKALEETLKAEREAAYKEQLKEERKAKKNQAAPKTKRSSESSRELRKIN